MKAPPWTDTSDTMPTVLEPKLVLVPVICTVGDVTVTPVYVCAVRLDAVIVSVPALDGAVYVTENCPLLLVVTLVALSDPPEDERVTSALFRGCPCHVTVPEIVSLCPGASDEGLFKLTVGIGALAG